MTYEELAHELDRIERDLRDVTDRTLAATKIATTALEKVMADLGIPDGEGTRRCVISSKR
jgi:hypothetical protein